MSHYFLGVPLPEEVRSKLHKWSEPFKNHLNYGYWTDPRDYHITLLFLGAVEPHALADLVERLSAKEAVMRATNIKLSGFGTFGKKDQPRVLWMGVDSDRFLYDDQSLVKECVVESGLAAETRPYKPHITIAKKWRGESRITPDDWDKMVPSYQPLNWTADTFHLFEVNPQEVPRYKPVHSFSLNK